MTPPQLVACYFTSPMAATFWQRLARVLDYTAGVHCPAWDRRVEPIDRPSERTDVGIASHIENTHKLAWWHARVQESADGDRLLLIDADTAIIRPLDSIWDHPFDVAYTTKTAKIPLNGGVVFLRISARTRAFMRAWVERNAALLTMPKKPWRQQFGGVNQASLAAVLADTEQHDLVVERLPCLEWNCEDSSWAAFDPAITRILHVKSSLRRACLMPYTTEKGVERAKAVWKQLDVAASRAVRSA